MELQFENYAEQPEDKIVNSQEDMSIDSQEDLNAASEELYTVDTDPSKHYAIFGGKNNTAEIYNLLEERTVTRIEDFTDSVLYTKFLPNNRFLIITVNGILALMEYEKEVSILDIEEDISVAYFDEKLIIGTVSGKVYLYDDELEHINTFGGHVNPIISVDYKEGRVLSMCSNFLIAHSEVGKTLYTLKAYETFAFKYLSSDVICFARDQKIQIFKEQKLLFEYKTMERTESIELVEKNLVIGGEADSILLIDTTGHYGIFKLKVDTAVNLIKKVEEYTIAFSTVEGLIGVVDIRSLETLRYFKLNIGVLFDFSVLGTEIAVVGQGGFEVIKINKEA
ncbi:hypothetical protein GINT2_001951 [Glugoides intestinalis]